MNDVFSNVDGVFNGFLLKVKKIYPLTHSDDKHQNMHVLCIGLKRSLNLDLWISKYHKPVPFMLQKLFIQKFRINFQKQPFYSLKPYDCEEISFCWLDDLLFIYNMVDFAVGECVCIWIINDEYGILFWIKLKKKIHF